MKKSKMIGKGLAVIMTASITLGGCGTGTSSNTDSKTESLDKNQVLNFVAADFKSLDPNIISDGGSFTALTNVYDGLMRQVVHDDGKVTAEFAGAESVDVSKDGLTYTFHLRKNAKWSDGKPVTAEQYVYSWKRIIDPATGADYMTLLAELNIKGAQEIVDASDDLKKAEKLIDNLGVKAKDDYTLEVTLAKPTPFFINAMTMKVLVPVREDKVKAAGDKYGSDINTVVFNGPFVMSDYQKGSKITYTKNKNYWNANSIKLDTANCFVIDETTTIVKMFESGELDLCSASKDDLARLKQKAQNGEITYIKGTGTTSTHDCINVTRGVLKNAKVRKALSLAIDRQECLNIVYKSKIPAYGLPAMGVDCSGNVYRSTVKEPIKTDKEQAKKLMAEGLKEEGVKASEVNIKYLLGTKTSITSALGDYISKLYKDTFGINLELEYTPDSKTFYKQLNDSDFDIVSSGWGADYDDVSTFFDIFLTGNANNSGHYSNKEYDKLVKQADCEQDAEKRINLYKQAEKILVEEDAAMIPSYYSDVNIFTQNYVKGSPLSKFSGDYDLSQVYISGKEN